MQHLYASMLHEPFIHYFGVALRSIEGHFQFLKIAGKKAVGVDALGANGVVIVVGAGINAQAREYVAARPCKLQEGQALAERGFRFATIAQHHVKARPNPKSTRGFSRFYDLLDGNSLVYCTQYRWR